jgi:hypothetical protein
MYLQLTGKTPEEIFPNLACRKGGSVRMAVTRFKTGEPPGRVRQTCLLRGVVI